MRYACRWRIYIWRDIHINWTCPKSTVRNRRSNNQGLWINQCIISITRTVEKTFCAAGGECKNSTIAPINNSILSTVFVRTVRLFTWFSASGRKSGLHVRSSFLLYYILLYSTRANFIISTRFSPVYCFFRNKMYNSNAFSL